MYVIDLYTPPIYLKVLKESNSYFKYYLVLTIFGEDMSQVLSQIDIMTEDYVAQTLSHISQKVEAFAELLRISREAREFFKTVLKNAVAIYLMLEGNREESKAGEDSEYIRKTLASVMSGKENKVAQSLFLAHDITLEFLAMSSLRVT